MTRRWSDSELRKLDTLHGVGTRHRISADVIGRSANAVRVMASRRHIEHQRVEDAQKLRDVSCGTEARAS